VQHETIQPCKKFFVAVLFFRGGYKYHILLVSQLW